MPARFMRMTFLILRDGVDRIGGRRGGSYRDRTWVAANIERISQRLGFVLERILWPKGF